MNQLKYLAIAAIAAIALTLPTPKSRAQVSVSIGPAPVCPYGYYDYPPYPCAPYGYYGPTWFVNGVFIGAGPWFHGPHNFYGHVNNHYDPHHGYHGPMPERGAKPEPGHPPGHVENFKGNETRDGRGHTGGKH
ncbi:MAG TPA: hypothetical protein VME86_14075 [Acidobacteriaceae bacterium]|nr:hypothetical protein [Acidobacteriaceae bacterium]